MPRFISYEIIKVPVECCLLLFIADMFKIKLSALEFL